MYFIKNRMKSNHTDMTPVKTKNKKDMGYCRHR